MCGNRRSRLQGKNGGICVMMSNSTFLRPCGSKRTKFERPLGSLHLNTELVTCGQLLSYYFQYNQNLDGYYIDYEGQKAIVPLHKTCGITFLPEIL